VKPVAGDLGASLRRLENQEVYKENRWEGRSAEPLVVCSEC